MGKLTLEQRKAALDAIAEMRAGTEEISARWDKVYHIQELGRQHEVIVPAGLAQSIISETEGREEAMPAQTKVTSTEHEYNEGGERIIVTLPPDGGTQVTACYDEDENLVYLRWYDKKGKLRHEIPLNEAEWKKLTAATVDEWSDNDDEESDADDED